MLIDELVPNKDFESIKSALKGKTVLVTGAAGSLGSSISKICAGAELETLLLLDISESGLFILHEKLKRCASFKGAKSIKILLVDIRDHNRTDFILKTYKPQVVFHTAAYKHVPLMEENPDVSLSVNLTSSINLVDTSCAINVERFVFVSTDKASNPESIMGATKLAFEYYLQQKASGSKGGSNLVSIRSGNIFGSSGSVIPLFQSQIACGGPITITHEECTRYFISTEDSTYLIIKGGLELSSGRYTIKVGQLLQITDIAHELLKQEGKEDIAIEYIGLREGERLHESLVPKGQELLNSEIPQIMKIADPIGEVFNEQLLGDLEFYSSYENKQDVKRFLASFLPDYNPLI